MILDGGESHLDLGFGCPAPSNLGHCLAAGFVSNLHGVPSVVGGSPRLKGAGLKDSRFSGKHYVNEFATSIETLDRAVLQVPVLVVSHTYV